MLTNFGKFCRKQRIDNGKLLFDMANQLGVSSAFLSKVENGKAKPPIEWEKIISTNYDLTEEQLEELEMSIKEARNRKMVKIPDVAEKDGDLMLAFARKLNSLSDDEKVDLRRRFDF